MLSFVVPVFDEEESIEAFYQELKKTIDSLSSSYEILFIDDGSRDNTLNLLKKLATGDKNIKIYSFLRNHSKAEALTFGFQKAEGDLIVTLDADLQDKPSEIKKLLDKQREGFDLVNGWRKDRRDPFFKKIFSKTFNKTASFLWGVKINDLNCGLKLYTKDSAKSLNLYGGMHRFIPLIAAEEGFRITEIPVLHDVRRFGKSKYSAAKVVTQLPDIFSMYFITKFGKRPLHFFGFFGGFLFFIGFLISLYLSILWFLGEPIGARPLFFLGILLILAGLQIAFTGLIADFVLSVGSQNKSKDIILKYQTY